MVYQGARTRKSERGLGVAGVMGGGVDTEAPRGLRESGVF